MRYLTVRLAALVAASLTLALGAKTLRAQEAPTFRKPSADVLEVLRAKMEEAAQYRRFRDEAIREVDRAFFLSPPAGLSYPRHDSWSGSSVQVTTRGTIRLGERAFARPTSWGQSGAEARSPAWLAATKLLGYAQWQGSRQILALTPDYLKKAVTPAEIDAVFAWEQEALKVKEYEAMTHVLKHGEELGLTKDELKELAERRDGLLQELGGEQKRRVLKSDFAGTCAEMDLLTGPPKPAPPARVVTLDEANKQGSPLEVRCYGNGTTYGADIWVENNGKTPMWLRICLGTILAAKDAAVQRLAAGSNPDILVPAGGRGYVTGTRWFCTEAEAEAPRQGVELRPSGAPPTATLWPVEGKGWPLLRPSRASAVTSELDELSEQFHPTGCFPEGGTLMRTAGGTSIGIVGEEILDWTESYRPLREPASGPARAPSAPSGGLTVTAVDHRGAGPYQKSLPEGKDPTFAPGEEAKPPPPTKADWVAVTGLYFTWLFSDWGGDLDRARKEIHDKTRKQFEEAGLSAERAKAGAEQVTSEIMPALEQAAAMARQHQEAQTDFSVLDLALKSAARPAGAPEPPATPSRTGEVTDPKLKAELERALAHAAEVARTFLGKGTGKVTVENAPVPETTTSTEGDTTRIHLSSVAPGATVEVRDAETARPAPDPDREPDPPPPTQPDKPVTLRGRVAVQDPWGYVRGADEDRSIVIDGNRVTVEVYDGHGRKFAESSSHTFARDPEKPTLEEVVRKALENEPPKPTPAEIKKACGKGAFNRSNANTVAVLDKESTRSRGKGGLKETSQTHDLLFQHSWEVDCKTMTLTHRIEAWYTDSAGFVYAYDLLLKSIPRSEWDK